MQGFYAEDIEEKSKSNTNFRQVLYTGRNTQLVLMSIAPGSEIGSEVHEENDQFFRFEAGQGEVTVDDSKYAVGDGSVVIVPAGAQHNVVNLSTTESLQLYTLYSPPHHQDGIVRATKEEAEANEADFDGTTTE
jgi:mannose-6-phosphate isomerase-like protein (cupin superfamily)